MLPGDVALLSVMLTFLVLYLHVIMPGHCRQLVIRTLALLSIDVLLIQDVLFFGRGGGGERMFQHGTSCGVKMIWQGQRALTTEGESHDLTLPGYATLRCLVT